MKKISRRAILAAVLAAVLLIGTGWFVGDWSIHSRDWLLFPGSPHVYENGRLAELCITDRHGNVLMTRHGENAYADDPLLRASVLHLLGDPTGNIPDLFTAAFRDQLVDFRPTAGLYRAKTPHLRLTVSAPVQMAALEAMEGRKGVVAVYNYETGEIVCALSSPSYDPLEPPDFSQADPSVWDGVYVNRFLQGVYVPGSVFKLVTAAAALETLPDAERLEFTCEGEMEFGVDKVICAGEHGTLDLPTALAKSCNCAFAQLALQVGAEVLEDYAARLGVADAFTFDGITTGAGRFDLSVDASVNVAWAGIGQYTDLVTPYGFLRFMGVLAGGGTAAEPYLVSAAGSSPAETRQTERLLREDTASVLRTYMAANVETVYGAGHFPGLTVCAKSGTAEIGEGIMPHATFAGFCADPELPLAFFIVVENGGAGSAVCAPIAGRVLSATAEALKP